MAIYSLTYDLISAKNYEKLYEGIEALTSLHTRPTESQWIIETPKTVKEIRDHLRAYVDKDDKIFVAQILMPKWASLNVKKESTDWLHERSDHN
jgi:hypothetical protein